LRAYDIIYKKRNGGELTGEEIRAIIRGYMSGDIPDYQMAALTMAVFFKGMNGRETSFLTMAMVESGEQADLSAIAGTKTDKHSTGGVGDKTTLVVGPLVAAAGVPVAKMSGRGLGHTGGTIDKLESIPGFNASLDTKHFIESVNRIKIAISGQTGNLAPADKKLYALRDVTATVESIPLIASSIMSKKIASGADAIVLDVKTGSGAFMKTLEDSVELARAMVEIGTHTGRRTVALITDMEQPLGRTVGNAVEVMEAVQCLRGDGPEDLEELSLALGSHMLHLAGGSKTPEEAREKLLSVLKDGRALQKFRELVVNQGGDPECLEDWSRFPSPGINISLKSPADGYVSAINAELTGLAAMTLGAGRETKDSPIDLAVGIRLDRKTGEKVKKGQPLATVYANDPEKGQKALDIVRSAYEISNIQTGPPRQVHGIVTSEKVTLY